jgi:glyoxylase-like metal-dependent hydrolase (beta-lactamase superfamily II)
MSSQAFKVGDLELVRVVELEFPLGPAILPIGREPAALVERSTWAQPHFVTEDGDIVFALSALALASGGQRIVIDPCLSFDLRRENPDIAERAAALLDELLPAAGFAPDRIDLVLNTHIDGVGWNVRPRPEGWVPSFPNARALFTRLDIERVRAAEDPAEAQSLAPLFEAGLVNAVEAPLQVTPEISLRPSPGHTVGNVDIWIESQGESAVVVGDHILNPLQCADPDWVRLDAQPERAPSVRRALLEECAERNTLVIGPHFGSPGAGHVRPDGAAWRLDRVPAD